MVKSSYNFMRVGIGTPIISVANPKANEKSIIEIIERAKAAKVGLLIFPQLAVTGVSCGDLFLQQHLYDKQEEALLNIATATADSDISVLVGHYKKDGHKFINGFSLMAQGSPLFFDKVPLIEEQERWFYKWAEITPNLPMYNSNGITFGLGEDVHIQIEFSAAHQLAGREKSNREKVITKSRSNKNCYVFLSPSLYETTSDKVYGGKSYIGECGKIIAESQSFSHDNQLTFIDVDLGKINYIRRKTFVKDNEMPSFGFHDYSSDSSLVFLHGDKLIRKYSPTPFIPKNGALCAERCKEIFEMQANALAMRINRAGSNKTVLGISGGLDSTLALLVTARAYEILKKPAGNILGITMPGFGTTGMTYNNALSLIQELGATSMEISIKDAVLQHFKDIGQDINCHDVTYENAQARERTQVLMDVANKEGGFVVGTGDLSEEALGWCTYNGDHMAMYNVNSSVPKTLIREIVRWAMDVSTNKKLSVTLGKILETPISPELLPPDEKGNIAQITEDNLGPYELHDFFIYHTIHDGAPPEKLMFLATVAFEGVYGEDFIRKWLKVFYRRFFTQQFKRSCAPDGIGVGSISLSVRGDFIIPADADFACWIEDL